MNGEMILSEREERREAKLRMLRNERNDMKSGREKKREE